ncbi:MAG: tetratricopeptide repeat protein [Acidobacteria bacterium]|nr:tetratricopeptide repeat protein [Acidobacteriota bacterium]
MPKRVLAPVIRFLFPVVAWWGLTLPGLAPAQDNPAPPPPAVNRGDDTAPPSKPFSPDALVKARKLYEKACRQADMGDFETAAGLFNQALGVFPMLPGAYVELGRIRMARKDPQGALDLYLKAKDCYARALEWVREQKSKPGKPKSALGIPDVDNFYYRHILYRGKGDYARHRSGLDSQSSSFVGVEGFSKEQGPFTFERHASEAGLGMRAFSKLYPEQAEPATTTGNIPVPPGEVEIPARFYLFLGGAWLLLEKPAEAERELLVGIAKDPEMAELYVNLSVARFKRGDYVGAANAARAAKVLKYPLPAEYVKAIETRGKLQLD